MLISTAQAPTKFALRKSQFRRHRFTGCSLTFSDMNFILRGRCKEIFSCGGQKREVTWQVRGIGDTVKIVAGAVFGGRCHAKRWQACVIRRIAYGSYVLRWMGSIAFLELELEDAFPWPVQHFV